MKKFFAVLAFAGFMSQAGLAQAGGCYGPREVEAEQGLRIHSELMVIGLTCARAPGGQELYRKYTLFTRKHEGVISGYESALIGYYRAQGLPGPEKRLHSLRTDLANTISQHAISMSTKSFCQQFGPRIDKALAMDGDKFRRWAGHTFPGTPTTQPVCARR